MRDSTPPENGPETAYAAYLRKSVYFQNIERTASFMDGQISITELSQSAGAYPDPPLPCFNFQLLLEGTGIARLDLGGVHWAGHAIPGQVFLAGPNIATDYQIGFRHRLLAVSVDHSLMYDISRRAGVPLPKSLQGPCSESTTAGLVAALAHLQEPQKPAFGLSTDVAATSIMTSLVWALAKHATDPSDSVSKEQFAEAKAYVLDGAEGGIGVAELADFLRVNRFQLNRATQKHFGKSPTKVMLDWRFERALHLVEQTEATLSDIALHAGFSDQAHMTRAFKQAIGSPPGVHRAAVKASVQIKDSSRLGGRGSD